ncbi:hypothetical protein [Acinetobacter sp. MF4640]|uniref:hypothetical protein n=1 Tax=Acinetobacter sp. MF4640 TaxID=1960826 RepID=UPI000994D837|nr:hypothetical protein [Acinetobacter sp. MF4640]OOW10665.1 hypothetical protein MF4640_14665 [Acinetobacter sp. MF4640]
MTENTNIKTLDLETFIRSHFFEAKDIDVGSMMLSFIFLCMDNKFIDDESGETFYRLPYAEITKVIFRQDENKFSGTVLDFARTSILERMENSVSELFPHSERDQKHYLSCYKRFTEHMLLACIQRKHVEEITNDARRAANRALVSVEKAEKTTNDITTQFVTILGIFASIIVALFGGMSLVKAAVELLTNEGSLPLFVFVVSVLMLSFSGLIVLLTTWITSLNKERSENSYLWTKVVLFGFLLICCFGSGLISYDLSKKPKAEKEKTSTDVKFELKATK